MLASFGVDVVVAIPGFEAEPSQIMGEPAEVGVQHKAAGAKRGRAHPREWRDVQCLKHRIDANTGAID